MELKYKNSTDYYNKLNLYFYAIVVAPLMIFIIALLQNNQPGNVPDSPVNNGYLLINCILVCAAFYYSLIAFRKRIKKVKKTESFQQRLDLYMLENIKLYLAINIAGLAASVLYLTEKDNVYAALYASVLILISIERPSVHRLIRNLKPNEGQKEIIIKGLNFDYSS